MKRRLGWIPDVPDKRDLIYAVRRIAKLPSKVDLRDAYMPAVYDQGSLGSCTANAIGAVIQFERNQATQKPDFNPSRLFIYYNERAIEHSIKYDSGAMIRDGIKSIVKLGVCSESIWPYKITKFTAKPSLRCYNQAKKYQAIKYERIGRTLNELKSCLASGNLIVFGFSVYESFMSTTVARTGIANMPKANEVCQGGHAVVAVGFDDSTKRFLVRNSWGTTWGQTGYFTMPYDYLLDSNLSDDFWNISAVKH